MSMSIMIFACSKKESKEKETPTTEKSTESVTKNCTYTYNDSTSTFEWKAYKTNEKIGVNGTFNGIKVSSTSGSSVIEMLNSISFIINAESVNSNDKDRDGKLTSFFFAKMIGAITGKVKSIDGNDSIGTATFEVTMNEITKDVSMTYTTTDGIINFSGAININNFNGQEAIKSLNKKCEALHTGADGVSVLWPQVSLAISTKVSVSCELVLF